MERSIEVCYIPDKPGDVEEQSDESKSVVKVDLATREGRAAVFDTFRKSSYGLAAEEMPVPIPVN